MNNTQARKDEFENLGQVLIFSKSQFIVIKKKKRAISTLVAVVRNEDNVAKNN